MKEPMFGPGDRPHVKRSHADAVITNVVKGVARPLLNKIERESAPAMNPKPMTPFQAWCIVHRTTGKSLGPYSTRKLARMVRDKDWRVARVEVKEIGS